MAVTNYDKVYINCYNLVIDITKEIKDFFYPNKYSFRRLDENATVKEKLSVIKKDLESMRFEKEISPELFKYLQIYYPEEKILTTDRKFDELAFMYWPILQNIHDIVKNKYLPFIRTISIIKYREKETLTKYDDEKIWELLLSNQQEVDVMESRINDVIWAASDGSKLDIADGFLKEAYKLNEIEYNRYLNGENNEYSSISKDTSEDVNKIKVNFKSFNKCFEDIFGQERAIETIRKVLLRNIMFHNAKDIEVGETEPKRGTLANFMFYGPTGTGKTEVAKKMAQFVFGNESKMLLLDMNSYKDSHVAASAIKGHPEGYVDSAKGTDFTRFLTNNTSGIIVLDEFEKASPEVREIFMTMLDEGKFKDALGNTYDLSSFIFVATTNVSRVFEKKKMSIGFQMEDPREVTRKNDNEMKEELRQIFTAPIMNRFNNLVEFKKIDKEAGILICKNLICKLCKKFESKNFDGICPNINIENIDEIVEIILEESNFKKDGVRCLKNNINDIIGSKILEEIIDGNKNITVCASEKKIYVGELKTANKQRK